MRPQQDPFPPPPPVAAPPRQSCRVWPLACIAAWMVAFLAGVAVGGLHISGAPDGYPRPSTPAVTATTEGHQ